MRYERSKDSKKGASKVFELTINECSYGLRHLFERVCGKVYPDRPFESATFDCTKIFISPMVNDQLFKFYKKVNPMMPADKIDEMLLISGPTVSLNLNGYFAEVDEGFAKWDEADDSK